MLSPITKKWQKSVQSRDIEIRGLKAIARDYEEKLARAEAKVEVFEDLARQQRIHKDFEENDFKSQIDWLRSLVERLTISPAVMKEITTRDIRMQEMHNQEKNRIMREQNRLAKELEEMKKSQVVKKQIGGESPCTLS